jgi:ATP-dependent DNA helicase RecG
MTNRKLHDLLKILIEQPIESEWLEFKQNFHSPEEIGKRISGIANSICLMNKKVGYLVFGIEDKNHKIIGTDFKAKEHKIKNEELENWLINRLTPRIDFTIYEFDYNDKYHISLFEIPAAKNEPVKFSGEAYIRVGSATRKLSDFPEKESKIWRKERMPFESEIALDNLSAQDVINLLSTQSYFDLLKLPYPTNQQSVIERFLSEAFIVKDGENYAITKLGAILFAKDLNKFNLLKRKIVRIIVYKGKNKIETEREKQGIAGYAVGFSELIEWINSQLPANEEIGKALRKEFRMYPEIAIREIFANSLIHQDFNELGFPMVEIFSDRIEISNPGLPLIEPERFFDEYVSRNEKMADIMRRMGFCEEKGSRMDKVIHFTELHQLPAIKVFSTQNRTSVVLFSYKNLNEMDKEDKIRSCYQHSVLKYISNEKMTNQSLRQRFNIQDKNYSIASRIIKDTIERGLIKEDESENKSRRFAGYIPFWA